MMSAEAIYSLARQQAVKAAAYEVEPYNPASPDECYRWKRFPFPNIGIYRPAGWCLVGHVQADKSGISDSLSLGADGLKEWCSRRVTEDPTAGFAVIEEGEFQLVVGYFSQAAGCTDEPSGFTWAECPYCDEPVETQDGEFVYEWCPSCDNRIKPEETDDECPKCGAGTTYKYDKEHEDNDRWCKCGHTWNLVPFKVGDRVHVRAPFPGYDWPSAFDGVVTGVSTEFEVVCIEHPEEGELDIPWVFVSLAYNPANDPAQLRLDPG
jgi:hypothetical protein